MQADRVPRLSADELSSATGEPTERLQQLRSLGIIGPEDAQFSSTDIERVRLVQFLERRQIPLDVIALAERDEAVLTSVLEFLYPRGIGKRYSFAEAVEMVGLDVEVARRLLEASVPSGEQLDEHDLRMLTEAQVALDAGFPEAALLQLVRVYADALGRVAEAEVGLFHFYVHEELKATGLAGQDLLESRKAVRDPLLPIVGPMVDYFHRRGMVKSVREDMVLHVRRNRVRAADGELPTQLRLAIVFLDISSYTPITAVMGDAVAAKLVERLSELVRETTIRFDGRIVDRVGDGFLLVFPEPRAALMCAIEIERRTAAEPQFPALRSAVHWGDLVYQEGEYVGGSLNLTSRVATEAAPHQILVTAAAREEIGLLDGVTLAPLGRRQLKGLAEGVEVSELRFDAPVRRERVRDPVCGMEMIPSQVTARLLVDGGELYFCCERCLRLFLDAPHKQEG